jgi:hypothetical protein
LVIILPLDLLHFFVPLKELLLVISYNLGIKSVVHLLKSGFCYIPQSSWFKLSSLEIWFSPYSRLGLQLTRPKTQTLFHISSSFRTIYKASINFNKTISSSYPYLLLLLFLFFLYIYIYIYIYLHTLINTHSCIFL